MARNKTTADEDDDAPKKRITKKAPASKKAF